MKIVINDCFGGFSLSPEALQRVYELGCTQIAIPVDKYWGATTRDDSVLGKKAALERWHDYLRGKDAERGKRRASFVTAFTSDEKFVLEAREIGRTDEKLIRVVEEMGEAADGAYAALKIIDIPDGVEWQIEEYDGTEWVAEKHRTWR